MAITISGSGITSSEIADGTITNADINASAAIVESKLSGTSFTKLHGITTSTGTVLTSTSWVDVGGTLLTVTRGDTTSGNKYHITYSVPFYITPGGSGWGVRLERSFDNTTWTTIIEPANGWGAGGYGGDSVGITPVSYLDTITTTTSTVYYKLQARCWSTDTTYLGYHLTTYPKVITGTVLEVRQ